MKNDGGTTQRREYFRAEVSRKEPFTVSIRLDAFSILGCRLKNISIGGAALLAVRHPIDIVKETKIKEITITFPNGQEIRCPAVVRYVLGEPGAEWGTYGIQFTHLSDAHSRIIAKYVLQAEAKEIKGRQTRRRVAVHEPESFDVILELDAHCIKGCRLIDIGFESAAIAAPRHPVALETDSKIKEVAISFPSGEEISSPAVVTYVLGKPDSKWNTYVIQFTGLSFDQSHIIARYVHQIEG